MLIRSPKELALLAISQRKKLQLSQTEISKQVGLKQQTISEFEIDPTRTRLDTLFRILSALDLDIKIITKKKELSTTVWDKEW